jgi:hypothetical protein
MHHVIIFASLDHHGMSTRRNDLIFAPNKAVTWSRCAVLFSLTIKPSELEKRTEHGIATRI